MEIRAAAVAEVLRWAAEIRKDPRLGRWVEGILDYTPPSGAFAAFDGRKIVGAATTSPGKVVGVFVCPSHQRRGIGTALMIAAVKRLQKQGWSTVVTEACDTRVLGMIEKLPPELRACLQVRDVRRDE